MSAGGGGGGEEGSSAVSLTKGVLILVMVGSGSRANPCDGGERLPRDIRLICLSPGHVLHPSSNNRLIILPPPPLPLPPFTSASSARTRLNTFYAYG